MRILHAVHDYLPEQVAGVEVYTNRIARRQSRRDGTAILFARLDPERPTGSLDRSTEDALGLFGVVQNRDWTRFAQTWCDDRLRDAVEQTFDAFAPDLLHIQHLMHLGRIPIDVAEARRVPVVMTLHDQWLACAAGGQRFRPDRQRCDVLDAGRCGRCTAGQVGVALSARGAWQRRAASAGETPAWAVRLKSLGRSAWRAGATLGGRRRIEERWRAMRALADRIDRFVSPSRDLLEQAVEFGLPRDRIEYLPHGLPERSETPRALPERALRFGILGSVVPHKGLHVAVEAFADMPTEAELEIVGSLDDDPGYVAELRRLARHRGIRFAGECPPEAVADRLDGFDVLVAPSIWRENAPLGVQEAFRAGRPVVASRLGGHVELLERGGGLLVEPGDAGALGAAMRRCATESGLVRRLAADVPPVADLDAHCASLDAIYTAAIADPLSSPLPEGPSRSRAVGQSPAPADDAPPRAVLLDRDGVVNFDRADYVRSVDDWEPIPGSLEAIARLSRAGVRVAVVTNQSGVGRGLIRPDDLERIHARLLDRVRRLGGVIDEILTCPHTPDEQCRCRKPAPGLIERGCQALGVTATEAVVVGDRPSDLEAARRLGCRSIFVRSGATREGALGQEWGQVPRFDDLRSVVDRWLLVHEGSV